MPIRSMKTPPICNYEGSDYQESFWEKGGRAYEDAVESIALRRLLPRCGELMLELGAGAGRNTARYRQFEHVVLVDYSTTQLAQAQERLGAERQYTYVAADIYRLPFVSGLFDAATMIRTLHHMAEARLALTQVRRVLQNRGRFILEYANKRNLKAILRYMMRRQDWSPFSPEPVEFASLNYDFHPASIRQWLMDCDLVVEKQLTVSHLRMDFLKKTVPLALLVGLDSIFQYTGGLWQLTPSVFVLSRAEGEDIEVDENAFFQCPACGHHPLNDTPPEIVCPTCGSIYKVNNNIYDFRLEQG